MSFPLLSVFRILISIFVIVTPSTWPPCVSPGVPDLSLESWLSRYSKLIHGCRFLFLEAYQGQYQAKKTVKGLLWSIPGSSPGSIIQNYLINK